MENKIYRIISFPNFVNLITKREERFVHPTTWEDTYEGIFFTAQKKPEKCELLLRELCSKYSGDLTTTLTNFLKCLYFPLSSYSQCWSKEMDSDALWRIYNYDKMSVQICTTDECWQKIVKNHLDPNPDISNYIVLIKDVAYDLNDEINIIINYLQGRVLTDGDLCDMYFHKRPAFQHEKEKRILIFNRATAQVVEYFKQYPIYDQIKKLCDNDLENATIDTIVNAVKECLSNKKLDLQSKSDLYVDLKDIELNSYIKSVRLNPFAPDWIDDLVKELCQKSDLSYEGKSTLYAIN